MPYLSALEVCSRQGAIQIHVYLYLGLGLLLFSACDVMMYQVRSSNTLTFFIFYIFYFSFLLDYTGLGLISFRSWPHRSSLASAFFRLILSDLGLSLGLVIFWPLKPASVLTIKLCFFH